MTVTADSAAPAKARPEAEPFGPGSILWEHTGDWRLLLVLPSALGMQVSHPQIGAAVGQQSVYKTDPWGRLDRSLTSVLKWVYGGQAAIEEGKRLRELHKPYKGVDDQGRSYHALSAEPYAWVHLTAFEISISNARVFGTPFSKAEERVLYDEILQLGRILQVPERMFPPTIEDYWVYFDDMVASKLENHPTFHDFLETLEASPAPRTFPPLLRRLWVPVGWSSGKFLRFVTVGTLRPSLRELLGLEWTEADERRLRIIGRTIATTFPHLPERIRYMPIAHQARKAARSQLRLDRSLRKIESMPMLTGRK